jgi:hypothetical protein
MCASLRCTCVHADIRCVQNLDVSVPITEPSESSHGPSGCGGHATVPLQYLPLNSNHLPVPFAVLYIFVKILLVIRTSCGGYIIHEHEARPHESGRNHMVHPRTTSISHVISEASWTRHNNLSPGEKIDKFKSIPPHRSLFQSLRRVLRQILQSANVTSDLNMSSEMKKEHIVTGPSYAWPARDNCPDALEELRPFWLVLRERKTQMSVVTSSLKKKNPNVGGNLRADLRIMI